MAETKERQFFKIKEVAERWQVDEMTVRREIERKRLKATRIGGVLRLAAAEVARYERVS